MGGFHSLLTGHGSPGSGSRDDDAGWPWPPPLQAPPPSPRVGTPNGRAGCMGIRKGAAGGYAVTGQAATAGRVTRCWHHGFVEGKMDGPTDTRVYVYPPLCTHQPVPMCVLWG